MSFATKKPVGLAHRLPRRDSPFRVPRALEGEPGLFVVDATWGRIAPLELAPGVRTVAELELIEHLKGGLPLVDTRSAEAYAEATIPGARNLPWRDAVARRAELSLEPTVMFCNGPQCAATPAAIEALLGAGHPRESLRYYRGGMHDWVTLGLPVEPGSESVLS